jgi:uncharacterized membrane protein
MNQFRRAKPMTLLMGLYVILFFFVVVPFHHHADCANHDDNCIICVASHQPSTFDTFSIVHVLFALFILIPIIVISAKTYSEEITRLRSPPLF